jgi:diguanylate cyclase
MSGQLLKPPSVATPVATASAAHIGRALLLIAALSIVLMSLGAFFVSYYFLHEQTQRHLRTLITFTASQAETAVRFRDTRTSEEILRSIPDAEGITLAEVRDANGEILARIKNDHALPLGHWIGNERISQDVVDEGKRIGTIIIEGGSRPLLRTLFGLTVWCVVGMLTIALCALIMARRYTRRITAPIMELRTVVQRLIEHRDFSQRAPPSSLSEVEDLRTEFNILLDEIGVRDRLLTETNAALRRVAYIDTLTGLPNRALFEQSLERVIAYCARADARAGLFYLDLDGFKAVNDTLGHAAGDALLSETGARLRVWLPEQTVAARIGGDEFVVLISLRAEQNPLDLANELQAVLDAPMSIDGVSLHPGISIGTAIYPDMTRDVDELIRLADHAMYSAKDERYRQNRHTRWEAATARRCPT